jgi:peptide/nickel transport system substrate-binding protein
MASRQPIGRLFAVRLFSEHAGRVASSCLAIAMAAASALALSGCTSHANAAHDAPAAATVAKRDRIVFGISWEPVSFHPLRALDSGSYYAQTLVYEGLIKYDKNLQLVPGLAEWFQISDDNLDYSFRLRRGLKFGDGSPLGLDDVQASITAARSDSSPFKTDYKCIKQVELKVADNLLVLHLKEPSAPLLARLAELRILPARLMNAPDRGASVLGREPVASGPFLLKRWEAGLELVFTPNPNYWGEKPHCEQLVWRIVPDKTLLGIALRRGELDVAAVDPLNCSATLIPRKQARFGRPADKNFESTNETPVDVEQFNGTRTVYLGFNMKRAPFNNQLVRQAVCSGINRNALAEVLFAGYASVPRSDVSPGSWAYHAKVKTWPFDQRLSAELLQQAGYTCTNHGWYQNSDKGKQLCFRILTVKDFQDVAQVISDDLGQIGVPTEVQVLEYTTLRAKYLKTGDFDVFLWSRSAGTDPECSLVWGTKGPLNFINYSDKTVDALIQQGRDAMVRSQRARIYGDIQAILAEQLPWVFLVQPRLLIAHKPDINNIKQANQEKTGLPWDNPLFNAPRWERRNRE